MPKTKLEKIAGIEEEIRQLENRRRQLVCGIYEPILGRHVIFQEG